MNKFLKILNILGIYVTISRKLLNKKGEKCRWKEVDKTGKIWYKKNIRF